MAKRKQSTFERLMSGRPIANDARKSCGVCGRKTPDWRWSTATQRASI